MTARHVRAAHAVEVLEIRLAGEHLPRRPQWECQVCEPGTAWPCAPAQVLLAEAYGADRTGLGMYLGALLFAATAELPAEDPQQLHERIVGWIR